MDPDWGVHFREEGSATTVPLAKRPLVKRPLERAHGGPWKTWLKERTKGITLVTAFVFLSDALSQTM